MAEVRDLAAPGPLGDIPLRLYRPAAVAGPASAQAHGAVMQAADAAGGSFTLFRAPASLAANVAVLPEEPPALAAIARRVKAVLDPQAAYSALLAGLAAFGAKLGPELVR